MSEGPRTFVAVLGNPRAGRGRHRAELTAAVATLSRTGIEVRLLEADTADAAAQACRDAVEAGARALVAGGGDGTVHLAIQAVAGTGVPLGVLPAGTGNDFATQLGVNADLGRAARDLADAVVAGRSRSVDLARLRGPDGYDRWFGTVLAAGFDAIVNERGNRMRWPRGPARYHLAILAELARLRARRYRLTFDPGTPDARTLETDGILVAIGNTASYGGGMRICPEADCADGLLDIVIGGRMSRTTLVGLHPRLFHGTHVRHPLVTSYRARTVEIDAEGITAYADGERICPLPVTVTADAGALRLLG